MAVVVKTLLANAGDIRDAGLVLGSERSPGGRHGNPLQCSCLENPMDPLDKNPMPGHLFELHPVNEVNTKGP